MATSEEEKILDKITGILTYSKEFKDFHGKIVFHMAFGQCKKHEMNQVFISKKALDNS